MMSQCGWWFDLNRFYSDESDWAWHWTWQCPLHGYTAVCGSLSQSVWWLFPVFQISTRMLRMLWVAVWIKVWKFGSAANITTLHKDISQPLLSSRLIQVQCHTRSTHKSPKQTPGHTYSYVVQWHLVSRHSVSYMTMHFSVLAKSPYQLGDCTWPLNIRQGFVPLCMGQHTHLITPKG